MRALPGTSRTGAPTGATGENPHPRISVVIGSYQGAKTIGSTLRSLARQTLAFDQFEVVVAQNGELDPTDKVIADVRADHPGLQVRRLVTSRPGLGRARNAGMAFARGTYTTFVDDDDVVSERYLEALLACSAPDVVGVAHVADMRGTEAAPDFDNRLRHQLVLAGRTLPPGQALIALTYSVGKLLPTALARAVGFDPDLRSSEDIDFYLRFFIAYPLPLAFCPLEAEAVYYRSLVSGSMSRQKPSYDFSVTQRLDVIERLEALTPTERWHRSAVARMVRGLTLYLNHFLREHPDRYHEVLADIGARQVAAVPYAVMNADVARDLAILDAPTGPGEDPIRILTRRGRAVRGPLDVVVAEPESGDQSVIDLLGHQFVDSAFRASPADAATASPCVATACRSGLGHIVDRQHAKGRYRSVYSAGSAPAAHLLAAWYKIRHPDVPWTAEIDTHPVTDSSDPELVDVELLAELRAGLDAMGTPVPRGAGARAWADALACALADNLTVDDHRRPAGEFALPSAAVGYFW